MHLRLPSRQLSHCIDARAAQIDVNICVFVCQCEANGENQIRTEHRHCVKDDVQSCIQNVPAYHEKVKAGRDILPTAS